MDEQRVQVYLELIQALLNCPEGQKGAVLQQHSDLVDGGLVQVMGSVVAQLRQQGDGRTADWLEDMAGQLAQGLGGSGQGPERLKQE